MSTASSSFNAEFGQYQRDIKRARNERERAQYFIEFLRRIPDIDDEIGDNIGYPTDIRPELEQYLSTEREQQNRSLSEFGGGADEQEDEESETVFVDVSGRLDARVGNLVIEFKDDLEVDIDDAEEQLRTYVYLLHEEGIEEDFLCLATDGELFITYETLLSDPLETELDVRLSELTRLYTDTADTGQVERWVETLFTERLHPVVEELDAVFGVDSDTFEECLEFLEEAYAESDVASVHRQEWSDYLTYAQGESPDEEVALFLRHTYLASFAKMLSYMVFTRGAMPSIEDAKEVLSGEIAAPFPDNLFEEDLFAWVGRTDVGDAFVELLIDRLLRFNLGRVDQDVFKKLYQDMVSYEVRHDLGEYYTPDWLAEHIVREKLELAPDSSVLDPGCGSGTFLVEAIQWKRECSQQPANDLVTSIPREVVGIDIHPLAVMIAKANYVASIRDLLPYRRDQIQIPVYLADSVLFDQELQDTETLEGVEVRGPITISEEEYYLPQTAIQHPAALDAALDLMQDFLDDGTGFGDRLAQTIPQFAEETAVFERIRSDIARAASQGRDSIHTFILKNFLRPLYLSDNGSFDAIIGNPPWLTYRYMGETQQDQTRTLLQRYGLHPGAENVVNMELATLFVARCVDLYLGDGGQLGFVMPRSIFTANQHSPFRKGQIEGTPFKLTTVLDLEEVSPLFNVPASTIIARKEGNIEYPVAKETFSGALTHKNLSWEDAHDQLELVDGEIFLHGDTVTSWDELPEMERSEYHPTFYKGADIWPRVLWFVQLQEDAQEYGFDRDKPPLISSDYAYKHAKRDEYKIRIEGEVEKEFLYETLLGGDLVPFTNRVHRTIVLPSRPDGDGYSMLDADQARDGGNRGLEAWLRQAEDVWATVDSRIDTIYENINYRNKINRQNPRRRYKVLYPEVGTNLSGCVVDTQTFGEHTDLPVQGFIASSKTFFHETDNEDEAYYLSAILNSNRLNDNIKNLQSRGDFGERDIHKLPWEFAVPLYDESNPDHQRLSKMGRECEVKAAKALVDAEEQYKATWKIREVVRDALEEEMEELDAIVDELIQSA